MKGIVRFFDKLEDKVRGRLRRYPIIYTLVGGIALILFWRGVWHTADLFPFMTGPVSLLISLCILLITGLFVSFFITDQTILTGINQEKRIAKETESEVKHEERVLTGLKEEVDIIKAELDRIEQKLDK